MKIEEKCLLKYASSYPEVVLIKENASQNLSSNYLTILSGIPNPSLNPLQPLKLNISIWTELFRKSSSMCIYVSVPPTNFRNMETFL